MPSSPFERLDAQLLDRFLAGDAMPDEVARVEHALARSAALRDAMAELRRKPLFASSPERTPDVRRGRALLAQRLDEQPLRLGIRSLPLGGRSSPWKPQTPHQRWAKLMLGLTAVGVLVASISVLYRTFRGRRSLVTSHVYATAKAQRLAVTLGEGANVVLAPETRLRYTVDDRNIRSVELIGEAFFTVVHGKSQPFVVRTGAVTTRVLGTAFDVRRYAGDRITQIAVVSGRVATGGRMSPVVLDAGTVGYLTDSSVTVTVGADPEQNTSWTQGNLIFHNAPAATVLATLGRWYGYEFRLSDTTLASTQISVGLSTDQPSQALNMVKAVLGVSMTFDGNIVTLRPERKDSSVSAKRSIRGLSTYPESEVGK